MVCTKRILLIEDDVVFTEYIKFNLSKNKLCKFDVKSCLTLNEGIQTYKNNIFDAVLLDLNLPDSSCKFTFQKFFDIYPYANIIIITGVSDDEYLIELTSSGAKLCLLKEDIIKLNSNYLSRNIIQIIEHNRKLYGENMMKLKDITYSLISLKGQTL